MLAPAHCANSPVSIALGYYTRRSAGTGKKFVIIVGANVENAAYPVGTCAERVAFGTAVVQGHKLGSFKAVGVATDIDDFCSPCGMCRQFLREFLNLETPIFMFNKEGKYIVRTMGELLPLSFGPDVLPPREQLKKEREGEKTKAA